MDENKPGNAESKPDGAKDVRGSIEEGLAIETGFEVWLSYLRNKIGDTSVGQIRYESRTALIEAIAKETEFLWGFAEGRSATIYFQKVLEAEENVTKGSEHYVIRFYSAPGKRRVLKATYSNKFGRYEYSPTLYLNSLRLVQRMVPELDIRLHGVLSLQDGPSIVTSMSYIPGRHPRPQEVSTYLHKNGWHDFHDCSQTLDFINEDLGQIIRDGHANNWIRKSSEHILIPIDISIEEI